MIQPMNHFPIILERKQDGEKINWFFDIEKQSSRKNTEEATTHQSRLISLKKHASHTNTQSRRIVIELLDPFQPSFNYATH